MRQYAQLQNRNRSAEDNLTAAEDIRSRNVAMWLKMREDARARRLAMQQDDEFWNHTVRQRAAELPPARRAVRRRREEEDSDNLADQLYNELPGLEDIPPPQRQRNTDDE
jgi:hypothetical protein